MAQQSGTKDQLFSKPATRLAIALAVGGAIATGGTALYSLNIANQRTAQPPAAPTETPAIRGVTALGRLEPSGEVIQLSASNASMQGARVAQLLVSQGDQVRVNQVIAVLDNRDRLAAAVERAQRQVKVAQANLAIVRAGAKTGVIGAQQATIKRLEAESKGEKSAQQTTIDRLKTQLSETEQAQDAIRRRLEAELASAEKSQDAIVRRLEAELRSVQTDFARYQQLAQEGALAASELDNRRLKVETAIERVSEAQANRNQTLTTLREQLKEAQANRNQTLATLSKQLQEATVNRDKTVAVLDAQINEANANLEQIKDVRPVDIQQAEAEVESAIAAVGQAQADLETAYVRAPVGGRILKLHTLAGETVDAKEGVAELGQTNEMVVVAEVYESDIAKVRLGQRVTIESEGKAFEGELRGSVSEIGLQIGKKDVLSTDPAAAVDARVVEVKVRLNPKDSKRVAGLTYSKVIVEILL
ncbi:MAG TPA: HlyD family efflux transporter periplasmic adaptor subunit [Coleofasciculaceae cyanobacterium]|jgi:HlyD family secretion protein